MTPRVTTTTAPSPSASDAIRLLRRTLLACKDAVERGEVHAFPELSGWVRTIWGILARQIAASLGAEWSADDAHPGLVQWRRGDLAIALPWNAAHAFPTDLPELPDAFRVARTLRDGQGVICLSGSILYHGVFGVYSDVDCCHYVEDSEDVTDFLARATRGMSGAPCFGAKAYASATDTVPSWTWRPGPSCALPEQAQRAKGDFVSKFDGIGPIEVTNLLLVRDPMRMNLYRSHPLQEAPLDPAFVVPRVLDDPDEIGRYLLFLHHDVEKKAESDPVKAAKRLYALAALLQRTDVVRPLIDEMRGAKMLTVSTLKSRARMLFALEDGGVAPELQGELRERLTSMAVDLDVPPPPSGTAQEEHDEWKHGLDSRVMGNRSWGELVLKATQETLYDA